MTTPPSQDTDAPHQRKVLLVLEYEGTAYAGFQAQKGRPTVQQAIEEALFRLTGERQRLAAASRTDAGVHAQGQVATFRTRTHLPLERFVSGLNHYLPRDIVVREARCVAWGFDPRRHARSRTYRYTILNRGTPSPFWRRFAYHLREPLDVGRMGRAASSLVGRRDVSSFAGDPGPRRTALRRIDRAEVWRQDDLVHLEMEGDSFLPQQVRRTAGALVNVGRGRLTPEEFGQMLCSPRRGAAAWTLPPQGLCLRGVTYPERTPSGER